MFHIKNLHVSIDGKEILKGIDLEVKPVRYMPLWAPTVLAKAHWHLLWPAGK